MYFSSNFLFTFCEFKYLSHDYLLITVLYRVCKHCNSHILMSSVLIFAWQKMLLNLRVGEVTLNIVGNPIWAPFWTIKKNIIMSCRLFFLKFCSKAGQGKDFLLRFILSPGHHLCSRGSTIYFCLFKNMNFYRAPSGEHFWNVA